MRLRFLSIGLVAALSLVSEQTVTAGTVHVVASAPGPGVDFTQITTAIAAAQSGDTVLVHSGTYDFFTIDGKGINVVADTGADVWAFEFAVISAITVRNVPAGQSVTVRGIKTAGPPVPETNMIWIRDNAGKVWIEDCTAYGIPAVGVYASQAVTIVRCNFAGVAIGGDPGLTPGPPHPALVALGSSVTLLDTKLFGGSGASGFHPAIGAYAYDGAPAMTLTNGTAVITDSTLDAGDGGKGQSSAGSCVVPPGDGGHALVVGSAPAIAHATGSVLLGGAAGAPAVGCPTAVAGTPVVTAGGLFVLHDAAPPSLSVAPAAREGQVMSALVSGTPNVNAFLLVSFGQGSTLLPAYGGTLVLASPTFVFPIGALPASGSLSITGTIPELGAGVDGIASYLQVATCGGPACFLGSASAILLLDASF